MGHERESVVRAALLTAIQQYYAAHGDYGIYASVETPARQITFGQETYDVSAYLKDSAGKVVRRVLVPVKSRETEGGGHAHLFTRDITSAIQSARTNSPNDFVVAVIVARNWSNREAESVRRQVDHASIFNLSPNAFRIFSDDEQQRLNAFIADVLAGTLAPKT